MSVALPDTERSSVAFRVRLSVIAAAALAWRVGYTLVTKRHDYNLFDEGDSFFYSTTASNLARGHFFVSSFTGKPAADHPPLTVLVLGPASWLLRDNILAQRLTMALIGTLAVAAIGLVGREVGGPGVGLAAAIVAAVNPNLWMNDAVVMSEAVSALLIALLLLAGCRLARTRSMRNAAIAGALCGLTVLARAEVGLFLPFMIWPLLLAARDVSWRDRLLRVGAATLLCAAVIAPWSVWNSTRYGDPVLVSTNDGVTLYGANCPRTYASGIIGSWDLRCVIPSFDDSLDAAENSTKQRAHAFRFAREHASRLPVVLLAREGRVWGWWRPDQGAYANQGEGRPEWASWAGWIFFWALVPTSVAGALLLRRRRVSLVPFGAAVLTVAVVAAVFYGIARFRLPVDVATCVLTGVFLHRLTQRRPASAQELPQANEPVPV